MFTMLAPQRINTATGYTLTGKTNTGLALVNMYNTAGVLLEQDVTLSAAQQVKQFFHADGTYSQTSISRGVQVLTGVYTSTGLMKSQNLYASDGVRVIQTESYTYTSQGLVSTKTVTNSAGVVDSISYTYTTNRLLNTVTHTNSVGLITETDYFINGALDHIVKPTPPVVIPPPPVIKPPAPIHGYVSLDWNNIDGHGEINVLKALTLATGRTIADITPTIKLDWSSTSAHFDDAWAAGFTGKGVIVADIDTGVDLKNPALTHNLSKDNWNFVGNNANVQDDNGHGSQTAGQMIAIDTGKGVVGGSYDAQLMVLKALGANGGGSEVNVANAVTYAVDHGANVINMSLGGGRPLPAVLTALKYAQSHSVLVVVAAGNDLADTPAFPALYANTLSNVEVAGAAASTSTGLAFSTFSNKTGANTAYGYVTAPGTNVGVYDLAGNVVAKSGTSFAAPSVASEMALLIQAYNTVDHGVRTVTEFVMDAINHATDSITLTGVLPISSAFA